ncbi:tetratricopeptide repeat protein [Colwelliaceae bacterium 6441]
MKKWLAIIAVGLIIAAGTCYYPHYITYQLNNNTENHYVLSYGKKLKLDAYFHYMRRNETFGSSLWIQSTIALIDSHPEYTLELGDFYLTHKNRQKATFWYQQAIRLDVKNAQVKLAKIFFSQQNYPQVKQLLTTAFSQKENLPDEETLSLLLEVALIEGDLSTAKMLIKHIEKTKPQHELLKKVTKFQVFESPYTLKNNNEFFQNCLASLQLFATNLSDLYYATQLIEGIQSHPLAKYSCFKPVRYIPLKQLNCSHQANEAITCDESIWQAYQAGIDTRFIGVLLPQGGAKVHNGIMYLDRADTVEVFAHELAHLLGFVDEYPIPDNHFRCSQVQEAPFAHNIAVLARTSHGDPITLRNKILQQLPWRDFIDDNTPLFTKQGSRWQLGTPHKYHSKIGLFMSDTCKKAVSDSKANIQAFKPIAQRTSLNYFELEFPLFYQKLLHNNAESFLMPSFDVNITKANKISY